MEFHEVVVGELFHDRDFFLDFLEGIRKDHFAVNFFVLALPLEKRLVENLERLHVGFSRVQYQLQHRKLL
jgi:hypothetical protein